MKIVTSLSFRGQCREAFDFYADVLGGKVTAAFPYGAALVINDNTSVMLVADAFFSTLSKVPITDPRKATEALFSLSLDSRAEVDELVRKAIAAGATEGHDPEDLGFMYSWGFVDLDGHQWGVFSMAAAPAG